MSHALPLDSAERRDALAAWKGGVAAPAVKPAARPQAGPRQADPDAEVADAGRQRTEGVTGVQRFRFDVTPLGKPRQTQRDKWAKRPAVLRYRAFADALRADAHRLGFVFPSAGLALRFNLPMPASWSATRKVFEDGQLHLQRPDLDNLVKALADALCPEDSFIAETYAEKRWARGGSIEALVFPAPLALFVPA